MVRGGTGFRNTPAKFDAFVTSKSKLPGVTPFLIASDVPGPPGEDEPSKEFAEVANYENFAATVANEENRYLNLYEIVRSMDAPVMAMFDVDRHDCAYPSAAVFTAFADALSRYVKDLLGRDYVAVPGETCQVADATTPRKTSLHVKLDVGMRSMHDNKRFALGLIEYVRRANTYPELVDCKGIVIDKKVYSNFRQFRMLYQAKFERTNYLMPAFGSSDDPVDHLWAFHPGHTREPAWWAELPAGAAKAPDTRRAVVHKKTSPQEVKKATPTSRMEELLEKTRDFNQNEALKQVMSGPVDVMAITRLDADDTHHKGTTIYTLRDAVCPYKKSKHTNNHVYLMTHAGSSDIHVRCHNEKCQECPSWVIYDHSVVDTPLFDEQYLDGMHQQAGNVCWAEDYDEPEMRDLPVERMVMVRAGMGTGKTKALLRLAERELADPAKKALIVTFSRTLAAKLHADFAGLGFVDYMAVKGGAPLSGPRIVVCLDSLWRVNTRNFDYVFIDEAVSVFLHFNSTKMERGHVNSAMLELLLLQCERMYFVDACVDTTMMKHVVDYFAAHRGCGTHWVRNRHVRPSNRKAAIEWTLQGGNCIAENILAQSAMSRVMSILEAGKNVVVCTSTKKFATTLEEYVRQKRGSTSVLSYYSGKSESLKDVETLWTSCQLLIYSPSVSAGVSFEGTHFDALVGFLVNSPATPSVDLSLQQLFRVRNLSDGDMFLYVQDFNADEDMPHTDEQVDDMLSADASIPNKYYLEPQLQAMSSTTIQDGRLSYDKSRMSYLIVKGIVAMRNKSLLRYRTILAKTLREDYGIPCTETIAGIDATLHELDMDVLQEAGSVSNDVAFADVPVFATMERGEAMYAAVAANMERASDTDKAGKVLHDYAMRKYQIDPAKIDERFYTDFVRKPDASALFFRAKRFALAVHKTPDEIRRTMSNVMDGVMSAADPNIKVYRTKLKAHYALLLKAQELIRGCLPCGPESEKFGALENVTITDETMCDKIALLKDSMDMSETKQFYKVLDLKESATTFVLFRKIMAQAFGFVVERQNDSKKTKAWHFIDIKQGWLRDLKELYSPTVLDAATEYEPAVHAPLKAPRFSNAPAYRMISAKAEA
jgi:Origin of replication binding protein